MQPALFIYIGQEIVKATLWTLTVIGAARNNGKSKATAEPLFTPV